MPVAGFVKPPECLPKIFADGTEVEKEGMMVMVGFLAPETFIEANLTAVARWFMLENQEGTE